MLLGGVGELAGVPGADGLLEFGALWILLGQVNLYRRVNELFDEADCPIAGGPPVHAWWALLPPPLDVVVGLRQVHYLARYWAARRGDEWQPDAVAEKYFPFIAAPRFTLLEFARTPSLWFWFTAEWDDFDLPLLGADAPAEIGRARRAVDARRTEEQRHTQRRAWRARGHSIAEERNCVCVHSRKSRLIRYSSEKL